MINNKANYKKKNKHLDRSLEDKSMNSNQFLELKCDFSKSHSFIKLLDRLYVGGCGHLIKIYFF